jgi:hypothetical protein
MKIPPSSIARPSKIFPIWDFWSENIAFGNTGGQFCREKCRKDRKSFLRLLTGCVKGIFGRIENFIILKL